MPAGEVLDLGERVIDSLGVERFAALEEGVFVTEVAMVRAAPRNHERVGRQVEMALDQVAAGFGQAGQGALPGTVHPARAAGPQVREKSRPGVVTRPEEDGVGMREGFHGKGGDVQSAQGNVRAPLTIVVGQPVGAVGRGDVDLNGHQIGLVVQIQGFDVFILDSDLVVAGQVRDLQNS